MGLASFNRIRRIAGENQSNQTETDTGISKEDQEKLDKLDILQKKLKEKGILTKKEKAEFDKLIKWKEDSNQTETDTGENKTDDDTDSE